MCNNAKYPFTYIGMYIPNLIIYKLNTVGKWIEILSDLLNLNMWNRLALLFKSFRGGTYISFLLKNESKCAMHTDC